jgi:hypothetical protein
VQQAVLLMRGVEAGPIKSPRDEHQHADPNGDERLPKDTDVMHDKRVSADFVTICNHA